jgi:4-alpha-glucanotransferase
MQKRAAVLLHPTSLPTDAEGILGSTARRFVDGLANAGFRGWQILPRNAVDATRSPYAALSAFAGEQSWIGTSSDRSRRQAFLDDPLTRYWLEDWCRFRAPRESHQDTAQEQFLFFDQWNELAAYARERDVQIIGDLPMNVSLHGADVWSRPELFDIEADGSPNAWCGVPPDDYCADGQLWRQPPHDWAAHKADEYRWWSARVRQALVGCDILRLDHFRGYEAWWKVPVDDSDARNGSWQPGPGAALFETLRKDLGGLPFWAEDLGIITPAVTALRERFDLPTTRVLQFAFPEPNEHDPDSIPANAVAYTGTHDNDTTRGWFESMDETDKTSVRKRLDLTASADGPSVTDAMIESCLDTRAAWSVIPMQDLLRLGSEARMNRPGQEDGQWRWKLSADPWTPEMIDRLQPMLARAERY